MDRLEAIDEVTRVVIGISTCCRHAFAPGMAKVQAANEAGIRLNVYGGNGITSVFVVCSDQDAVLDHISEFIASPKEKKDVKKAEGAKGMVHS